MGGQRVTGADRSVFFQQDEVENANVWKWKQSMCSAVQNLKKITFTFQTPIHGNFQLQTFLESQMYSQYCEHQVRCDLLMINDL